MIERRKLTEEEHKKIDKELALLEYYGIPAFEINEKPEEEYTQEDNDKLKASILIHMEKKLPSDLAARLLQYKSNKNK